MVALVWFRRDLRVHDHPALCAALAGHEQIVPVFCLDDRLLHGRHASGARTAFLLQCLTDLDERLAARGARLVIRHGPPERELPALARETEASEVHLSADPSPYEATRGRRVRAALEQAGASGHAHPGVSVVDDVRAILTGQGPLHGLHPVPPQLAGCPAAAGAGRTRAAQHAATGPAWPGAVAGQPGPVPGGGRACPRRGERRAGPAGRLPGRAGARLRRRPGPAGHGWLVAAVAVPAVRLPVAACGGRPADPGSGGDAKGEAALRRQLCWRDFYQHVLVHHPENSRLEFQPRYRGTLDWPGDDADFAAWTAGRTGFPLVDAGMRQLRREGWMNNRVRLLAGSFLTKDLGIDWRRGEAWFMHLLLDGDQASNNGNWQWIASVGVDPQPAFRRLYNPVLQQQRFDPGGRYVRRYLPELAQVPDSYLAEPWRMPPEEQQRAGCRIGQDYPAPIVQHKVARLAALDRYRAAAVTG